MISVEKRLQWLLRAGVLMLCMGCAISPHDEEAVEAFLQGPSPPAFHTVTVDNRSIHYAEVGNPLKPPVIFLHGTPGSWKSFVDYLADDTLSKHAHLIAIDRPGFGESDYKQLVPSLEQQSALIRAVLDRSRSADRTILVGHSLGASLAARIAMDFPGKVGGLVLVSPSLDPEREAPRWYNRLADCRLIRWMVPTELRLANDEVMVLQEELTAMLPLWQGVIAPVVVIQGTKDRLVDPENADFAARVLGPKVEVMRVPDADHFILWDQPELIREAILKRLNVQKPPAMRTGRHNSGSG